jgi:uncharacterized protein (DUF427 family)
MKALWNDTIVVESDDTIMVEGNHDFPVESVKKEYLEESNNHTTRPQEGVEVVR